MLIFSLCDVLQYLNQTAQNGHRLQDFINDFNKILRISFFSMFVTILWSSAHELGEAGSNFYFFSNITAYYINEECTLEDRLA